MAETPGSLYRSRTILLFCVGFILLGGLFLGTLYFSGQRGEQLQKIASTDHVNTVPSEAKKQTQAPTAEPKKSAPKVAKTTPKTETKKPSQPQAKSPAQESPAPTPKPKSQPSTPPAHTASKPLPATGGIESVWMTFPSILILAYAGHEFRRSRQAVQRAAFHENAVF